MIIKDRIAHYFFYIIFVIPLPLLANQALRIKSGNTRIELNQTLLSQIGIESMKMDYSRAYPKRIMQYRAINLCKLFTHIANSKNGVIEWIAKDNFSVFIPTELFMDCDKKQSIPYLAIEGKKKWPLLQNGTHTTAGPYAIIWTNPSRDHISNEYWAWSVTKAIIHPSMPKGRLYPPPRTDNASVVNGYQMYVSRCASCHSINGMGIGKIGPDLGVPFNPVQRYTKRNTLRRFIRDPASVKYPLKVRMSGSDRDSLSDSELDDLINYFKYLKNDAKASF